MGELINKHQLKLSEEEYENYLQQTRQQVVQQRVFYRAMLLRAQTELGKVSCRQLSTGEAATIKGLRQKYIITIGKFVYGREDTWMFEPTNDDLMTKVMRFTSKSAARNKALMLHKQLIKTCTFNEENEIATEGWKKELFENITQELDALEVE